MDLEIANGRTFDSFKEIDVVKDFYFGSAFGKY